MYSKPIPVKNLKNFRNRVRGFFNDTQITLPESSEQLTLDLNLPVNVEGEVSNLPNKSVSSFLDFLSGAVPNGEIYLFGGLLRDLAMYGRRGFNSDVDIVVDGDWEAFVKHLEYINAKKNKFGGFRFEIAKRPIDIWNARETWAIKNGYVRYEGIASLTETTVLNWDAILMNWRTGNFIYRQNYFEDIQKRLLDVVLDKNPNPLGMFVRVLRHLFLKDARKITERAIMYLVASTKLYSYEHVNKAEIASYGNSFIQYDLYKFFSQLGRSKDKRLKQELDVYSDILKQMELILD